ncbi:MAG: Mth938-like domain-containing protein [Propionivibrio sp.]
MKLQPERTAGLNIFTAYGEGYVTVNAVRHTANLIVLPERLVTEWTRASFETLSASDFAQLVALDAEVILLATGDQLRFPPVELLQPLILAQKGIEVMDIKAACRTYNVLVSENRKVAAALLFG